MLTMMKMIEQMKASFSQPPFESDDETAAAAAHDDYDDENDENYKNVNVLFDLRAL